MEKTGQSNVDIRRVVNIMHQSSYLKMEWFKNIYLDERRNEELKILDVGSYNMGGSYKALFDEPMWIYTGLDMVQGPNVDIIVEDCYNWKEIEKSTYDIVISGQAFEHMPYFWLVMEEIARVLKPDGICCIVAPSAGPEHRCPVDCYRFYADGMIAMADYVHMNVLCAFTGEGSGQNGKDIFLDNEGIWHDSVLVAQKGERYQNKYSGEKVVIWGTGMLASKVWNRIPNLDIEVVAFVDNDKARQGSYFRGIRVISPEELKDIDCDRIVICSHFISEISKQLVHELQMDEKKVLTYRDIDWIDGRNN